MNLLRPVSDWIFRNPFTSSRWLEGLEITQADIDSELLHPDASAQPSPAWAVNVTWLEEEIRA